MIEIIDKVAERMGGSGRSFINVAHIASIEDDDPDTRIVMTNGHQFTTTESLDSVMGKINLYLEPTLEPALSICGGFPRITEIPDHV